MPEREAFHFQAIGVMDVIHRTPLLDIKPYAPRFDVREKARSGWMEEVDEATIRRRGCRTGRSPGQF